MMMFVLFGFVYQLLFGDLPDTPATTVFAVAVGVVFGNFLVWVGPLFLPLFEWRPKIEAHAVNTDSKLLPFKNGKVLVSYFKNGKIKNIYVKPENLDVSFLPIYPVRSRIIILRYRLSFWNWKNWFALYGYEKPATYYLIFVNHGL